jgi:protein arginine kinase
MLCEACANRRGIIAGKGGLELNIDDLVGSGLDATRSGSGQVACQGCGLELAALRREGRLGCARCAEDFSEEIAKSMGKRTGFDPESDSPAFPPTSARTVPQAGVEASTLRRELEAALQSEDYERAATIRDELAASGGGESSLPIETAGFGFPFDAIPAELPAGPDDDVIISCSARIARNLAGTPFPGSPNGLIAPSRALLRERILSCGPWRAFSMAELGPALRRSLSERGIAPRGYAADDEATLLCDAAARSYALLDDGDHLRVRTTLQGFDIEAAIASSLALADRLGGELEFARRPGLGWILSKLADCGLGCSLSATVHIPALTAAGMRDRLFRALMADGLSVRGFYSSNEESAGSVYELGMEISAATSLKSLAAAFSTAAAKVVAAERRARAEISERGRGALVDAEGRAFGITRYFGLTGTEEAASLLSVLRLASLRGSLRGADSRFLGALLGALGPGSIALASGLRELPSSSELDGRRAKLIKEALARADYRFEEGA